MVCAESLRWLDVARPSPVDADRAAAQLRRDYERWSRWALGLLAFVVATFGLLFAGALLAFSIEEGFPPGAEVVIGAATALGVGGTAVLVMLWQSGRRLTRAAAAWTRLPYEVSGRTRTARGWLEARTVNFEPPIFVRITTATLALLVALAGIAGGVHGIVSGEFGTVAYPLLLVGILALMSGLGQFGGVMRVVSGLAEADPLWHRIRGG